MACVYIVTSPTGRQYIGMTRKTASQRFASHVRLARFGANNALSRAIRKHGVDGFNVTTLLVGSAEYCALMERRAIAAFRTGGGAGYNEARGGEGCSLEGDALAKRNARIAAFYATAEGKAAAVSRANKRWDKPGAREQASSKATAALSSPESKAKLSAAQKRLWADPAERAKRAAGIAGAFADPEVKARLVAAQKRGNADPDVKARKSEIMRQRMADPEVKRRTVERMLAARGIQYKGAT